MLQELLSAIGVYKVYGRWLKDQLQPESMPRHVGIITDGNRRWAKERGEEPWKGHWAGEDTVKKFLEWSYNLGIKTLTFYAFSTENFNRDSVEVGELMKVYEAALREVLSSDTVHKNRVRVRAIGRINLLPAGLQKLIKQVEEETKDYNSFYLNVALAYGGRAEIVDAVRKIAEKVKTGEVEPEQIDEDMITANLYTSHLEQPEPDLIIRTGSESRLSNFLLWQSAYSELFIVDVFWPDFREIDLWRIIRSYQNRERRYGK